MWGVWGRRAVPRASAVTRGTRALPARPRGRTTEYEAETGVVHRARVEKELRPVGNGFSVRETHDSSSGLLTTSARLVPKATL